MTYFNNGSGFTVTATRRDVEAFRRRWPRSGLGNGPATFAYDENGDLIDARHIGHEDGPALAALAADCRAYGRSKRTTTGFRGESE